MRLSNFFHVSFFFSFRVAAFLVEQRVDSERSSAWVLGIAFSCRLLQDLLVSCLRIPSQTPSELYGPEEPHTHETSPCAPRPNKRIRIPDCVDRDPQRGWGGQYTPAGMEGWISPCFLPLITVDLRVVVCVGSDTHLRPCPV